MDSKTYVNTIITPLFEMAGDSFECLGKVLSALNEDIDTVDELKELKKQFDERENSSFSAEPTIFERNISIQLRQLIRKVQSRCLNKILDRIEKLVLSFKEDETELNQLSQHCLFPESFHESMHLKSELNNVEEKLRAIECDDSVPLKKDELSVLVELSDHTINSRNIKKLNLSKIANDFYQKKYQTIIYQDSTCLLELLKEDLFSRIDGASTFFEQVNFMRKKYNNAKLGSFFISELGAMQECDNFEKSVLKLQLSILNIIKQVLFDKDEKIIFVLNLLKKYHFQVKYKKTELYNPFLSNIEKILNNLSLLPSYKLNNIYEEFNALSSNKSVLLERCLGDLYEEVKLYRSKVTGIIKKIAPDSECDDLLFKSFNYKLEQGTLLEMAVSLTDFMRIENRNLDFNISAYLKSTFKQFYIKINLFKFDFLYVMVSPSLSLAKHRINSNDYNLDKARLFFDGTVLKLKQALLQSTVQEKSEKIINFLVSLDLLSCYLNDIFFIDQNEKKNFIRLYELNKKQGYIESLGLEEKGLLVRNILSFNSCIERCIDEIKRPTIHKYINADFGSQSHSLIESYNELKKDVSNLICFSEEGGCSLRHSRNLLSERFDLVKKSYSLSYRDCENLVLILKNKDENTVAREFFFSVNALKMIHHKFKKDITNIINNEINSREELYKKIRGNQVGFFNAVPVLSGGEESKVFLKPLIIINKINDIEQERQKAFEKKHSENIEEKLVYLDVLNISIDQFIEVLQENYNIHHPLLSRIHSLTGLGDFDSLTYKLPADYDKETLSLNNIRSELIKENNKILFDDHQVACQKLNDIKAMLPWLLAKDRVLLLEEKLSSVVLFEKKVSSDSMTSNDISTCASLEKRQYEEVFIELDEMIILIKKTLKKNFDVLLQLIEGMSIDDDVFFSQDDFHQNLMLDKKKELDKANKLNIFSCINGTLDQDYSELHKYIKSHKDKIEITNQNQKEKFIILVSQLLNTIRLCVSKLDKEQLQRDLYVNRYLLLTRLHDGLLEEKLNYLSYKSQDEKLKCVARCYELIEKSLFQNCGVESLSIPNDRDFVHSWLHWLRINVLKPFINWLYKTLDKPLYGAGELEKTMFWAVQPIYTINNPSNRDFNEEQVHNILI